MPGIPLVLFCCKKEEIMSEIQEAVQIIRVGYDGVEIAIKVGSGKRI